MPNLTKKYKLGLDVKEYVNGLTKARKAGDYLDREVKKYDVTIKKVRDGLYEYTRVQKHTDRLGNDISRTYVKQATSLSKLHQAKEKETNVTYKLISAVQREANAKDKARIAQEKYVKAHAQALKINADKSLQKQIRAQNSLGRSTIKYTDAVRKAHAMNKEFDRGLRGIGGKLISSSKKVDVMTVAWKSFFRLIALRAAAGGIFLLRSQLVSLAKDFATFNKSVAEIQTIIDPAEQTAAAQVKISDQIVAVSIANNIALTDSVKAFYANLSNQVSNNLGGLTQFTNTAIRLSKATVSTLEDAGNAISSVVQAYNLSFADAEAIAASLFKTVDEGRLRLNEFANTLGRVGVPAAALGVSYDEVNAALARLTLQGLKANQGQTLLLNFLIKLQKPSKELIKLYRTWGVESGEAAIKAFGLTGVLQRLFEATEDGSVEFAELFTRIRALVGAQGLAGSGPKVEKFIATLTSVSGAAKQFQIAVDLIRNSAGEKFQSELNKTRTLFIDTFGSTAVELFNNFNDKIKESSGEMDSLGNKMVRHTGSAVTMLGVITGMSAAFGLVRGAAGLFFGTLTIGLAGGTVALGIGLIASGFALVAGNAIKARIEVKRFRAEVQQRITDTAADNLAIRLEEINKHAKEFKATSKELRNILADANVQLNIAADLEELRRDVTMTILENHVKQAELIVNSKHEQVSINGVWTVTNTLLKRHLKDREAARDLAIEELKTSRERVKELSGTFEDASFDRRTRHFTDVGKINAQLARSSQMMNRAFNASSFEEGRAFIDKAFQLLVSADAKQFELFGFSSFEGRFQALQKAAMEFERRAQVRAKANLKRAQADVAPLGIDINVNELSLENAKGLVEGVKLAEERIKEFAASGLLNAEAKANAVKNEIAQLRIVAGMYSEEKDIGDELAKQARTLFKLETDRLLVQAQMVRLKALESREGILTNAQKDAALNIEQIFAEVGEGPDILFKEAADKLRAKFNKTVRDSPYNLVLRADLQSTKDTVAEFEKEFNRLSGQMDNPFTSDAARAKIAREMVLLLNNFEALIHNSGLGDAFKETFQNSFGEITKNFQFLMGTEEDPGLVQQIEGMESQRKEISEEMLTLSDDLIKSTEDLAKEWKDVTDSAEEVAANLVQMQQDATADGTTISLGGLSSGVDAVKTALDNSQETVTIAKEEQGKLAEQVERTVEAYVNKEGHLTNLTEEGLPNLDVASQNSVMQDQLFEIQIAGGNVTLEDRLRLLRAISQHSTTRNSAPGIDSAPVKLAAGGMAPRGTDTIPAMLSPGEYVVNARSAQANMGLLSRINNSRPSRPRYYEHGGSVSNTFNNDISMTSSGNESLDARRLQRELNRGQRRGTSGPFRRSF